MCNKARKQINEGQYSQNSMLTAGWIMGIVGSISLILGVIMVAFYIIIAIVAIMAR